MANREITTGMAAAKYLLYLASIEDVEITPLKLQKLLFYVQKKSLSLHATPLFDDKVEAWENGPAIRVVWRYFKDRGYSKINPIETAVHGSSEDLPTSLVGTVEEAWDEYKHCSPGKLWKLTHKDPAWERTFENWKKLHPLKAHNECDEEIPRELMRTAEEREEIDFSFDDLDQFVKGCG